MLIATGEILDLSALFSLLPLSLSNTYGSISFAGYEDIYRGRIANTKKINKNFCDAISMRLQLSRKEISLNCIRSELTFAVFKHLLISRFCQIMRSILTFLEELLESIRQNPSNYIVMTEQFLESCRGDLFIAEEVNSNGEINHVEDYFLKHQFSRF